jgi:importin subunit alpha-1
MIDLPGAASAECARSAVKNGVDSLDCRAKRTEVSVAIRKNKREESLRKRRMGGGDAGEDECSAAREDALVAEHGASLPAKLSELPAMLAALQGSDLEGRVMGARALRKLLSRVSDPPVAEVLSAGALPLLCAALGDFSDSKLQFEAAWALTNIGSSEHTGALVRAGCLPVLAQLLMVADASLREQAAWCIGNIAGDCFEFRDLALGTEGLVRGVQLNLEQSASLPMLRNVAWVASNLCRGSKPKPALEQIAPLVPVLARIVELCTDEECVVDATWALSYVSDGENERVDMVVNCGACASLVRTLQQRSERCIPPTLRTLGNIVTGSDRHTQAALDAGLLRELVKLLKNVKASVRKEAAWALSNITAGTKEQIAAFLLAPGLPEAIVEAVARDEWAVRKEATWALCHVLTTGAPEHVAALVERHDAFRPLCDLLACSDAKIISLVLDALDAALKLDPDRYGLMVEECDGLDAIEALQSHASENIYRKALHLCSAYFRGEEEEEEEEDQNIAPNVDQNVNAFQFRNTAVKQHQICEPQHDSISGIPFSMPNTGFNFSGIAFN